MKSTRSLATLLLLASSMAVACVGEPTDGESIEAAEGPSEAEQALRTDDGAAVRPMHEGRPAKMGKHARGPLGMFMKGLGELDLSDDQQAALEDLRSSLRDGKPGERDHGALGKSLAPAIAAGNVTVAGFSAELDEIEAGAEARVLAVQKALNTLHATLTADQRVALVDAISEGRERHGGDPGDAEGRRAKRGKRGKGAERERAGKAGHMLGMLTKKLDLTDAQIAAVEALEPSGERPDRSAKRDEMKAKMQALSAAFKSDTFDAAKLGVGDEMRVMARAKAERMIEGLEKLVPILDEGQRAELAEMVERRAMHDKGARGKRGRFGERGQRPELDAPRRRR